jgi:hypothetical protein
VVTIVSDEHIASISRVKVSCSYRRKQPSGTERRGIEVKGRGR